MRIIKLLPALAMLAAPVTGAAQDNVDFKSTEIYPGIHMLEGEGGFAGGNVCLVLGGDGVILIDDALEPMAPKLIAAIEGITDEPIDFVVNTHVHGDHVGGNDELNMRGATVFAHDNIRRRLIEEGRSTAGGNIPASINDLPQVTFSDSVTFHTNGFEAFVFHLERAHTDGDGAVHFRNVNVIHAGDVFFNKLFPFIDLDSGGSVDGFIAAQRKILSMADDDTVIIPGHGVLADKADLQAAVDMLADAQSRVGALVAAGRSADEIVAENPLADYHDGWNWGFITTERMTRTLVRAATQAE